MRVFVFLLLGSVAYAADISAGSHMLLRLLNPVSTRTTKLGDPAYFAVVTPISDGNTMAVPQGSYVQGVVVEVERAGKIKGKGSMRILFETLTLPSGQQVPIHPRVASLDASSQRVVDEEGLIRPDNQHRLIFCELAHIGRFQRFRRGLASSPANSLIGVGAGESVGAVATLFERGRDVELPKGTDLDVVFDFPVDLQ